MPEVFAKLDADRDVRAIVLTGSGSNFSYGLDVPAMGGTLAPVLAPNESARPRAEFHLEVLRMRERSTRSRTAARRRSRRYTVGASAAAST